MSTSNPSLTLYRGWPQPNQHVWSPFVIKLEARLRFAKVPYETAAGSPRSAPKGKIPYVEFTASGSAGTTQMGDSGLIIKHLVELGVLPDLNAGLTAEEKGRDLATRALLEDKLYFYHTRERWMDNFYTMREYTMSCIPWPMRILTGQLAYRHSKATLYGQGTLRFTAEEVYAAKDEIWKSISDVLLEVRSASLKNHKTARTPRKSNKKALTEPEPRRPFWFLGGDEPTEVDVVLFGFIISVFLCTAGPESRQIVGQYPVLSEYAERIHDAYFPDYRKWRGDDQK